MARFSLNGLRNAWKVAPWQRYAAFIFVQFLYGLWSMPQGNFLPVFLSDSLGQSTSVIGAVVASAHLSGMITALLCSGIASRIGSQRMLSLGMAMACVNGLLFTQHDVAVVSVLCFVGGVGHAMIVVGNSSYLAWLGARGSAGMISALYAFAMAAGGILGNQLAGILLEWRGFAEFGIYQTVLILATALAAALLLTDLQDRSRASVLRAFWNDAVAITGQKTVRLLAAMRASPTMYYAMLNVLIPLQLYELSGSKTLVAAYGSASLIVAATLQPLVGRVADRLGARKPTLAWFAAAALTGLLLSVFIGQVWGVFLFGLLGVTTVWSIATFLVVWVIDGVPAPQRASVFGLLHSVWSLSTIVGSLLAGGLAHVMAGLPFALAACICCGAIFVTRAYYRSLQASSVVGSEGKTS
jgi:MFS family permease